MDRREFLKSFFQYGLLSLPAFQLGCEISQFIDKPDSRGAIVYGTHYGSTEETAYWIEEGIEADTDVINIATADFNKISKGYDFYVLGSGIWIDGIHKNLNTFLLSHGKEIDGKVLAAFVVCGSKDGTESGKKRIKGYLDHINRHLEVQPLFSRHFGGRLLIDQLTPEDREILEEFYRTYLNKEMENWNYMDKDKTVQFGKQLILS